jgi:hypothetical protein
VTSEAQFALAVTIVALRDQNCSTTSVSITSAGQKIATTPLSSAPRAVPFRGGGGGLHHSVSGLTGTTSPLIWFG